MNNKMYPCLLIKGKTAEAADLYIDIFGEGKIVQTSPYVVQIELSGQKLMLLNEGPSSSPNPSISFMVISEHEAETEQYWNKLAEGGKVMMPLGSYDWSSKYGWLQDKYGVSWQLYTGSRKDTPQKFSPNFMFTGARAGMAEDAIHFYTDLFPGSQIQGILKYGEGDGENIEHVKHAQFTVNGYTAMVMDSSENHDFNFNDAISLVVECDTQEEIDSYWNKLTANGGKEVACGWLIDKFGISWQIIPMQLAKLFEEPQRAQRVMGALMQMKKLVIADLENA
ncbi:MAG: VOC family protein [Chitinophagaceae bacterium]|nr:VOC family protein [Chitinophagaceae bacterium]